VSGWLVLHARDDGDTADVMPVDDLVAHEPGDACVCGPAVSLIEATEGGTIWRLTHHSLDGREKRE
jgi:hypothetical protein